MDYKKIIRSRAARENILRALAFIPDETMLRIQYRIKTGRALHLKHPTRFTEKLQWYKLYYRDPDMLRCVDKYEVRAYLRERGFQDLLPRCFGVFDSPDQLPVPQLPDRFVLKDTLGSGGNAVLLCPDKDRADWRAIRKTAAGWCATPLVRDGGREWPYYSGKPHRILAEEYLQPAAGAIAGAVSAMLRSDLSRYACESYRTALAYQGPVLDARRNAFFDRIRREVASASGGECS